MNETEAIQMMRRCSEEIKSLRRQIEVLRPKAEAYESIAQVLSLMPRPGIGCSEDVAWLLDKRIREMEEAKKDAT